MSVVEKYRKGGTYMYHPKAFLYFSTINLILLTLQNCIFTIDILSIQYQCSILKHKVYVNEVKKTGTMERFTEFFPNFAPKHICVYPAEKSY